MLEVSVFLRQKSKDVFICKGTTNKKVIGFSWTNNNKNWRFIGDLFLSSLFRKFKMFMKIESLKLLPSLSKNYNGKNNLMLKLIWLRKECNFVLEEKKDFVTKTQEQKDITPPFVITVTLYDNCHISEWSLVTLCDKLILTLWWLFCNSWNFLCLSHCDKFTQKGLKWLNEDILSHFVISTITTKNLDSIQVFGFLSQKFSGEEGTIANMWCLGHETILLSR